MINAHTNKQPLNRVTAIFADSSQSFMTAFRDGLLAELPKLRAFARSMARSPDRADDLVQETLAKAWAHRNKFREGTNLRYEF